jgi:hypothetical protein
MKILSCAQGCLNGLDRLALAFGYLAEPPTNNSIQSQTVYEVHRLSCDECDSIERNVGGNCERCEEGKILVRQADNSAKKDRVKYPHSDEPSVRGEVCQYVLFNPQDFYYYLYNYGKGFLNHFDRETQQKLVRRGVVGYLWGATVLLDRGVPRGYICLSPDIREKALTSKQSILIDGGFIELKSMKYTLEDYA